MIADSLERFERVTLGHWPTPLERLDRLGKELGVRELWVKRDDCSGLALGGNKVRKLEYLLADALAQGADTVITVGGVQSNHARQTAAAAARLGLRCELVLPRLVANAEPLAETGGNVLLDRLLGATVHVVEDTAEAVERVGRITEEAAARGGRAAFFPAGGSTAIGALGYVRAAVELDAQLVERGLNLARIVIASSSGGTQAGVVTGLQLVGREIDVTGMCVYAPEKETHATVVELVSATSALLESPPPDAARIRVDDRALGDGYGMPTAEMVEAVTLCARLEGLLLDPVYSGKAMAGLIGAVRSGSIDADAPLLFWHTGGTPALFVYPEALRASS